MRKIIYYVASSIDGFISGPNEDVSGFVGSGNGVEKYLADLKKFDTVIMGRSTYEFGYKWGLKPGGAPYPHMRHYIFSNSLKLENPEPNVRVVPIDIAEVDRIQEESGTDIYLCGGGQFAGWLLRSKRINEIKIKLNPLIQGSGTPLFTSPDGALKLELQQVEEFEQGLLMVTYLVHYSSD